MKFLIACLVVAVASASSYTQFAEFTSKYNKVYASSDEFQIRFKVFAENLALIDERNSENIAAGGEAVHGITQFADLTQNEFKATYLMNNYQPYPVLESELVDLKVEANVTVDWRTKGVLTPIKDQGQCGSCWAFSTVSVIESFAKIAGKPLQALSPQQIVSCDKVDQACNGGYTETGYKYVVRAGGLELESSYPYTSGRTGRTGTCTFDASKVVQKITGYKTLARTDAALVAGITQGPVSVCIAASNWNTYRGGILMTCPLPVDHCVQAVGFSDSSIVLRNQWGTTWGEGGYIRLNRGVNLCKVNDDATYPTF